MELIWQFLRAEGGQAKLTWQEKRCLKSAMANRQFPQTRDKACGWSEHDKRILCLHKIVEEEHTGARGAARTARDKVEATAAQIEKNPIGICIIEYGAASASRTR